MIKNGKQLADACRNLAENYRTLYVLGCIGAPMTGRNKDRYIQAQSYNGQPEREYLIRSASEDVFGFDCVCMIKALLWDWNGDKNSVYGGAAYAANGVPDVNADTMIRMCGDVSTDFSRTVPGCVLWMPGHIGVYLGDGLAVECTPRWEDGCQITAVHNIGKNAGYHGRTWVKHGRLPWLAYDCQPDPEPDEKTVEQLAQEVIQGKWGAGDERKRRLTDAGHHYDEVQQAVNRIACGCAYSSEQFIREVQRACGAKADGKAGPQTLSATPTLSSTVNQSHPAVMPVQKRLLSLGYDEIGVPDGIAGRRFERAVKRFQREQNCTEDGILSAGQKTWKKLLKME